MRLPRSRVELFRNRLIIININTFFIDPLTCYKSDTYVSIKHKLSLYFWTVLISPYPHINQYFGKMSR
jgi:hypothetical protein